jgi:tRNA dimethylallyltransferase
MNKTCIIIAGPTAVGKTSLAIQLAQHFSTHIISADSRQCYHELNIGVAKPSPAELQLVPHHFINTLSINESFTAAAYEKFALQTVEKIFETKDVAVMVGGTGLYLKAFVQGLDEIPETDIAIREQVVNRYNLEGMAWLQQEVKTSDPAYFQLGEIHNPQRLMRALEVKLSTGKSITSFQQKNKKQRNFTIRQYGLELPRPVLYNRINTRVDQMMSMGLEEEVQQLIPFKHLNALQTVGYRELFDYFDKAISREKAIEMIQQNTRHYAKRQMTWFKKDGAISWVDMTDEEKALQQIIQNSERS